MSGLDESMRRLARRRDDGDEDARVSWRAWHERTCGRDWTYANYSRSWQVCIEENKLDERRDPEWARQYCTARGCPHFVIELVCSKCGLVCGVAEVA